MKTKKAFTLIELLVVIAIIGLLMAVVVPSLRKAKEHAKLVICKSNQRSIVQASASYSADHDNKLPPTIQGNQNGWMTIPLRLKYYYGYEGVELNGGSVLETFGSYMQSPEYFDCPMSNHDPDWQERYIEASDNQSVAFLNSSYFMFWNWTKLEKNRPSFRPTDAGGDGLMTCDVIFYNEPYNNSEHGGTMWVSSHRWEGAEKLPLVDAMAGGTLNREFTYWMKDDPTGGHEKPKMKLNAGYKDGHVETVSMDDVEHVGGVYWLPTKRR